MRKANSLKALFPRQFKTFGVACKIDVEKSPNRRQFRSDSNVRVMYRGAALLATKTKPCRHVRGIVFVR